MNIDNRVLAGLIVFMLAVMAFAIRNNEISTASGNLILNASGAEVMVEKTLNAAGDVIVGGEIESVGADMRISSEYGAETASMSKIKFTSSDITAENPDGYFSSLQHRPQYSLFSIEDRDSARGNDGNFMFMTVYNRTDNNRGEIRCTQQMAIRIDNASDRILRPLFDNEYDLGTDSYRWADVKSVLINGADVCFENNVCMTECVNDAGQIDICFVYGKPTEDQVKSIGLASIETYQEYVDRHSTNGTFDGSMSEQEFTARRGNITVDGKLDLTLGRTSHGSIRDIKDALVSQHQRLNEIEATLCNQGIEKYC